MRLKRSKQKQGRIIRAHSTAVKLILRLYENLGIKRRSSCHIYDKRTCQDFPSFFPPFLNRFGFSEAGKASTLRYRKALLQQSTLSQVKNTDALGFTSRLPEYKLSPRPPAQLSTTQRLSGFMRLFSLLFHRNLWYLMEQAASHILVTYDSIRTPKVSS